MPQALGASSGDSDAGVGGAEQQIDINELTRDFQARMGETQSQLEQSTTELARLRDQSSKTDKILGGLRKVLAGDEGDDAVDPVEAEIEVLEGQIEQYLNAAVQAERAGRPIPLTVNAAVQALKGQIEAKRSAQDLRKQVESLKGTVERVAHPDHNLDQQAFGNIDSQILNALDTIYGKDASMDAVKDAQWKAVSQLVASEIKGLRSKNPEMWDRIRRHPTDQARMVSHFVKQVIPPRARQLLEDEQVRQTPLTLKDYQQAWEETKRMPDQARAKELRAELRPKILEMVYGGANRRGGQGINELMRG